MRMAGSPMPNSPERVTLSLSGLPEGSHRWREGGLIAGYVMCSTQRAEHARGGVVSVTLKDQAAHARQVEPPASTRKSVECYLGCRPAPIYFAVVYWTREDFERSIPMC